MSHEITSEDNLILHKQGAWHGLGTVLQDAPTIQGALQLAGLDWRVEKRKLYLGADAAVPGRGIAEPLADRVALQRTDTGRVLEVVSDRYEVFQNADLADLVDSMATVGAIARAETAGSLRQGRKVFFLVPRGHFTVGKSDEVRNYLLFSNSHDGTGALGILPTSVRVVCANTLAQAEAGFSIRHSASMVERVERAKDALELADRGALTLKSKIERLASVPMDADDRRVFFLKVYESAYGVIPGKPITEAEERAQLRARDTVSEWIRNLDSARNTGTGTEGTVWHALNAVTQWSDHSRAVRSSGDTERSARASSNLFGTSAAFKGKALALALTVAQ